MRGQIGTKHYDTEKADLIQACPDGTQIFRKRGRSFEFFRYNPAGETTRARFQDLTPADAEKYMSLPENVSKKVFRSGAGIQLSAFDRDRIKYHAQREGMSMSQFVLYLVDQYEQNILR